LKGEKKYQLEKENINLKIVKVELKDNSYEIQIGDYIFQDLLKRIKHYRLNPNLFFVIDESVERFQKDYLNKAVSKYKGKIYFYLLKQGENSKSHKELNKIYDSLLANKFGRDSLLVSIGGGVTGDLAGYAASTYMRGIQLIHIPTTLLASVDSAIGGKTGINFSGIKNIIGSFYQPKLVLIDTYFLGTLPEEEYSSGMGEIIKNTLLSGDEFFDYLNKNFEKAFLKDKTTLEKLIFESVKIKASVVSSDEKETKGLRKILNLGHTFAHAIESELNFRIKHGEAVTAGLICALFLSNKIGVLQDKLLIKYLELPLKINLSSNLKKLNEEKIYESMKSDKKNRNNEIKFVLLLKAGKIMVDVPADKKDVIWSIKKMKEVVFD
jgi:3-dehydroquinate synthase